MALWKDEITLEMINQLNRGTLGEHMDIVFTEIGEDFLKAKMPVNERTMQPFGLLHGGASVAFAETIGSVASWCAVDRNTFIGVGVEINASHIKPVTKGYVTAVCSPIKVSGKTHVWDIRISDENGDLNCICRFTAMVVPRPRMV